MGSPLGIPWVAIAVASLYVLYLASVVLYNIFFHPLRHFPGSIFWTSSRIPWAWHTYFGSISHAMSKLHARYGDVVRIAPDELTLIDPSAWKDIMAAHKDRPVMPKDPADLMQDPQAPENILTVRSDVEHGRMRRVLSPGFSEKAVRQQEPLIQGYVNLLMESLHEAAAEGPLNIVHWYEFVTFDIIGDLTFGESLQVIEKRHNYWITFINTISKDARSAPAAFQGFPHLYPITLPLVLRSEGFKSRAQSIEKTNAMATRRMAVRNDRKDFMSYALHALEKGDPATMMSKEEIMATFEILMIAGSETSATLLSGVTYLLLKNPDVLKKLVAEIRSSFAHSTEITIVRVNSLTYLLAVLDEALRTMPPVAQTSMRLVPGSGEVVGGHFVPGGTKVGIHSFAACHSSLNFRDPDSFVPERWLGDARYAGDRRDASQPFNIGPRGCLGRTLAYAEMRIILARVLFEFDLELMESSRSWLENLKSFGFWLKDPLMVRLRPVVR